jgi:hypothetical protein
MAREGQQGGPREPLRDVARAGRQRLEECDLVRRAFAKLRQIEDQGAEPARLDAHRFAAPELEAQIDQVVDLIAIARQRRQGVRRRVEGLVHLVPGPREAPEPGKPGHLGRIGRWIPGEPVDELVAGRRKPAVAIPPQAGDSRGATHDRLLGSAGRLDRGEDLGRRAEPAECEEGARANDRVGVVGHSLEEPRHGDIGERGQHRQHDRRSRARRRSIGSQRVEDLVAARDRGLEARPRFRRDRLVRRREPGAQVIAAEDLGHEHQEQIGLRSLLHGVEERGDRRRARGVPPPSTDEHVAQRVEGVYAHLFRCAE